MSTNDGNSGTSGDQSTDQSSQSTGQSTESTQQTQSTSHQSTVDLAAMRSELSELTTLVKDQNAIITKQAEQINSFESERNQIKYNQDLESKKAQLKEIDPRLAVRHKDVTDLKELDVIISTAQDIKSGFADLEDITKPDADKTPIPTYRDPATRKLQ